MAMIDNSENYRQGDDNFSRRVTIGWKWQDFVADHIENRGLPVERNREHYIRKWEERYKDKNEWDLRVYGKYIEVKGQKRSFGDKPDSFPLPKTIVMTVHSWNNQNPKPSMVLLVSQVTGSILGILCDEVSRKQWSVDKLFDHDRGFYDDFYRCDKRNMITFDEVIKWLLET